MNEKKQSGLILIGVSIIAGLFLLGFYMNQSVKTFKGYDRTVTVRGLAEQEHLANLIIWPVQFTVASNNQQEIYKMLEDNVERVTLFLKERGIIEEEISVDLPVVTDRSAQRWGGRTEDNSGMWRRRQLRYTQNALKMYGK